MNGFSVWSDTQICRNSISSCIIVSSEVRYLHAILTSFDRDNEKVIRKSLYNALSEHREFCSREPQESSSLRHREHHVSGKLQRLDESSNKRKWVFVNAYFCDLYLCGYEDKTFKEIFSNVDKCPRLLSEKPTILWPHFSVIHSNIQSNTCY